MTTTLQWADSEWVEHVIRTGVDADEAERCCQLFRTVESENLYDAGAELWTYKEDTNHGVDVAFDLPYKKLDLTAFSTELLEGLGNVADKATKPVISKLIVGVVDAGKEGIMAEIRGLFNDVEKLRNLDFAGVKVMGKDAGKVNLHPVVAAAVAQDAEDTPPLRAENDPCAGAICVSHAWDGPWNWTEHFGNAPFAAAIRLQASTAVRKAGDRELQRPPGSKPRVWVDSVSVPAPVSPSDHPLEQTVWGPFRFPIKEMKGIFEKVDGPNSGYTILRLLAGYEFEGTMQMRTWDERQRPSKSATPQEIRWSIPPGEYHVRSAHVIAEDKFSPMMAATKRHFRPREEQLRCWSTELVLRDNWWIEMTLGSLRCEYLLLTESMLAMQGGLVAMVTWNYFDRLWPLVEWAVFCVHRGPDRIQLAADALKGPTLVEYYRAIRRVSVQDAGCRDKRDRELLLGLIEQVFPSTRAKDVTLGFSMPQPCDFCASSRFSNCQACQNKHRKKAAAARTPAFTIKSTMMINDRPVQLRDITVPERERQVDYSALERYVRATAIAVFARESAMTASGERCYDDEGGWSALSKELGLSELHAAMAKCKPYDWFERISNQGLEGDMAEAAYLETVEAWWRQLVLPALEFERHLAIVGEVPVGAARAVVPLMRKQITA
jgi:hypothetical protein